MAQGISVHIGLNHVDESAYPDIIVPVLSGCLNDANDMKAVADAQGFTSSTLLDEQATADAVKSAISDAAGQLAPGDIFLLTYSGHGSQVPDTDNEETDSLDETWVLHDRFLIDDELYELWGKFDTRVRIFVLSDSCHSGTVARAMITRVNAYKELAKIDRLADQYGVPRGLRALPSIPRLLPAELALKVFEKKRDLYAEIKRETTPTRDVEVKSCVILISGCQDNQTSLDGDGNGKFTEKLKDTWDGGNFQGDYHGFYEAILAKMPSTQSPNYFLVGTSNPEYEAQKPFTVASPEEAGAQDGGTTGQQDTGDQQAGQDGGQPSGGTPSGPYVTATADSWQRSDSSPTFDVHTSDNAYYIFEITSRPELFDGDNYGAQRNSLNWYATWDDDDSPARLTDSTYQLSSKAWGNLSGEDRLYFRVGTTSTDSGWDNYEVSTRDDQGESAPSIQVVD